MNVSNGLSQSKREQRQYSEWRRNIHKVLMILLGFDIPSSGILAAMGAMIWLSGLLSESMSGIGGWLRKKRSNILGLLRTTIFFSWSFFFGFSVCSFRSHGGGVALGFYEAFFIPDMMAVAKCGMSSVSLYNYVFINLYLRSLVCICVPWNA